MEPLKNLAFEQLKLDFPNLKMELKLPSSNRAQENKIQLITT